MNPGRIIREFRSARNQRVTLAGLVRQRAEQRTSSAADISAGSADLLGTLASHAFDTCPYWQRTFTTAGITADDICGPEDLQRLPILEKQAVREYQQDLLSTAFTAAQRFPSTTGGSTAAPLKFYRNKDCIEQRELSNWFYLHAMGRRPTDRIGLVWGALKDLGDTDGARAMVYSLLMDNELVLPGNRMDDPARKAFVRRMRVLGIRHLHGYSLSIWALTRFCREIGLRGPALKTITVTAEPLTEPQKVEIRDYWQCPVYRVYGTREFGYIGAEVPGVEQMLVNPRNCIVETVDPAGQVITDGSPGSVIVTDLLNKAMPLIRYRIGDVAALSDIDSSTYPGFQQLRITAGRETDFIVTPGGRLIAGAGLTNFIAPNVSAMQIRQDHPAQILVLYVATDQITESELAEMRADIGTVLGNDMSIELQQVDDIPRSESGKMQYVVSAVARAHFASAG